MLKKALEDWGFQESSSDACIFLKTDMIVLVYVNDCNLVGKNGFIIVNFIKSLQNGPNNFIFTYKEKLDKYLGMEIK